MLSFPLLLYAAIGGGAAGLLARPRCAKLDARGASLALETALGEANAAAAGAHTGAAGAPDDGYVVRSTDRAGYARAAGIRPGDVLVSANGHALRSPDDALDAFIAARRAGRVSLDFRRGAQRYTVQVQLLRGEADLGG
jgi:S1-C subfamily serine protease